MTRPIPHAVVVGAGEAGARVAHELLAGDWPGTITLVGSEDRPPYERPPLSKAVLLDDDPHPVEPHRDGRLDDARVDLRLGTEVTSLDLDGRRLRLDDGSDLPFDALVLATGARARRLPHLPADVPTLRTYPEALDLRAALDSATSLLVVGGGLIGLEVAAAARTKGVDVTVVEASPSAMGRAVPGPVASVVVDRHRDEGVDLRLATTVTTIERAEQTRWRATLSDGSELVVDHVLQAVGSEPDVALAQTAGLDVADGIVVDEQMRASAPGVWAVGDCCRGPIGVTGSHLRLESWRMAHDQAVVAAASILGHDLPAPPVPWFWSDQYDLSLQVSGIAAAAERWVARPEPDGSVVHIGLDASGRVVCAAGAGRAAVAKDVRMAERLVAAGATPDPAALADPDTRLRSLLP